MHSSRTCTALAEERPASAARCATDDGPSIKAAFPDADTDTDILADSPDTPIHPCVDPREDVGVSVSVDVGVVECGLLLQLGGTYIRNC